MTEAKYNPVPTLTALTVHKQSRTLEIAFDDDSSFTLPFEFLRVYSPSAEVRGHGQGQEVLQLGKREVTLTALEPVGHYAVQPHFSDGHNTGIYTWDYLYRLGSEYAQLWENYLQRVEHAGFTRDTGRDAGAALPVAAAGSHACGHAH
jgi:DUF971 family protein